VGGDDAKIYVRRILRQQENDSYAVQLLRLGCPAKGTEYPISNLYYDRLGGVMVVVALADVCKERERRRRRRMVKM